MSRIVDLEGGRVMVVTDVHGDYPAYGRYRDRFLKLRAEGRADILLLCGDLIHSDGPLQTDGSLEIVLDVLRLRRELGESLIVLLGNHELPHLNGITIRRGSLTYGPAFERALGDYHPEVIAFFDSLPFYVRTRAGVAIAHAGACRAATTPAGLDNLANYSHAAELDKVEAFLSNYHDRAALRATLEEAGARSYGEIVAESLGITDPAHPRYDDALRGAYVAALSPDFQSLWAAIFNRNEYEYGRRDYKSILVAFLATLSQGYAQWGQRALVSGHIPVNGGYTIVNGRQLRLASWAHAIPPGAGQYLLFDAARPIEGVEDLLGGLHKCDE
ncbi:MAG: metallophosphoesterase family protein [Anaerolineales bacterium]